MTMRCVVYLALITLCLPAHAEETAAPAPAASGEPYLELELVGPLSEAQVRPLLEAHLADCIAQGVSGELKYIRSRSGSRIKSKLWTSEGGCADGKELTLPDTPEKKRIRVQASFGYR